MKKILKTLALKVLLTHIVPLNIFSCSVTSVFSAESLDESLLPNGLNDYAKSKHLVLNRDVAGKNNPDALGLKYNGGSIAAAAKCVDETGIKQYSYESVGVMNGCIGPQEHDEAKNCMAILLEYVSRGERVDFTLGASKMIKAILAFDSEYNEKKRAAIKNRSDEEHAAGVKYIASAVVQEMLINLRNGAYCTSLGRNYIDACEKVMSYLRGLVAPENREVIEKNGKNLSEKEVKSFVQMEVDTLWCKELVTPVIECVFGEIDGKSNAEIDHSKSCEYALYLRKHTIAGMEKYANKINSGEKKAALSDTLCRTIDFEKKINRIIELHKDLESHLICRKEWITGVKDVLNAALPTLKSTNRCTNYVGNCGDLNAWLYSRPGFKVHDSRSNINNKEFNKIIKFSGEQVNLEEPIDLSIGKRIFERTGGHKDELRMTEAERTNYAFVGDLMDAGCLLQRLKTRIIFDWVELCKYQAIMQTFSESTEPQLEDACMYNFNPAKFSLVRKMLSSEFKTRLSPLITAYELFGNIELTWLDGRIIESLKAASGGIPSNLQHLVGNEKVKDEADVGVLDLLKIDKDSELGKKFYTVLKEKCDNGALPGSKKTTGAKSLWEKLNAFLDGVRTYYNETFEPGTDKLIKKKLDEARIFDIFSLIVKYEIGAILQGGNDDDWSEFKALLEKDHEAVNDDLPGYDGMLRALDDYPRYISYLIKLASRIGFLSKSLVEKYYITRHDYEEKPEIVKIVWIDPIDPRSAESSDDKDWWLMLKPDDDFYLSCELVPGTDYWVSKYLNEKWGNYKKIDRAHYFDVFEGQRYLRLYYLEKE